MCITRLGTATVLAAAVLLGGCSSMPSWMPSWLGGSSSKSVEPAPLPQFSPSLEPRVAWRASVGSARGAVLQPAVLENAIYVAAGNGTVMRLGPGGETVWRTDLNLAISGGVGSDGFVVAVGSPRGDVVALGADGKELWRAQVGAAVQAPPLVGRGLVIVRGSDYRVTAFDANNGRKRWNYQRTVPPLTLNAASEMAFAGDFVAVGYPSGRLVMLAIGNGTVRWDAPVAEPRGATEVERLVDVLGAPRLIASEVCAAAYQGRVACFEVVNGNLRWAREFPAGAGVGADTRRVYGVDVKSNVVAFSAESGTNAWRQEKLLNRDLTTPLALRRAVLVGDYAGYLHFLSPDDGGFLARVALGSEINATPRAFGGGAIVQTKDGSVALVTVE
ncbi:MAG TPA: outer membrane protein assembly factor BamB [Burkholderiaceae bacterium]|nr:outer membrane protein assembly factor BamB [Burkholderiaceae bacterium]